MERIKYFDFDLLIEKVQDRYRARVLQSPAGQASAEFALPFSDQDIEILMLRVGRTRRGVRRIESPEMQAAKQFGGKLFDAVFSNEVRGALRSSVDTANRENAGLRVRLRLADVPELVDLPWEFLYNASLNRFLALSNKSPLVRFIELPETPRPIKIIPPLRVLVMISSPSDYEHLDVQREWQKLNDALSEASASNQVTLEKLETATLGALRRKLRQEKFHVLHFIGHGAFDAQTQDGVLLLEDEQARGRRTSGQYLAQVLTDHDSLRLVVLNACEGARTARTDPFAGVAQSLVQQGIPAVIAMQFEITDQASITFAHEFYAAVADGYPVDAALSDARSAIFSEVNDLEWGTPVLYLRASDGVIFAPLSAQERAELEQRAAEQRATAKRTREREQLLETLFLAAQIKFAENDFDAAEKSLQTLLAEDAENTHALELQTKIQEARVREQAARARHAEIETLLVAAQNELAQNDFDAAEKSLAALLALDAANAHAPALQAKLAELRARREQCARLVRAAQIQMEQTRLDAAAESIEQLAAIDPTNAQLPELRTQLADARKKEEDEKRRAEQIQELSRSADASFVKKDFAAAERSLAALLLLDAANAHALELQKQIQAARTQMTRGQRERERQQKVAALLALAQANFSKQNFGAADKALAELLTLDASNVEARKMQAKIQEARQRISPKPVEPTKQNLAPTSIPERAQPNDGMSRPARAASPLQGFPTRYAIPIAAVIILALIVIGALALGIFKLPGARPAPTRTRPPNTAALAQATAVIGQINTKPATASLKISPAPTLGLQKTLEAIAQKTFAVEQSNTNVAQQATTAAAQKTFAVDQYNTRVAQQTNTAVVQKTLGAAQANAMSAVTAAAKQSSTARAKTLFALATSKAKTKPTATGCASTPPIRLPAWGSVCDSFGSNVRRWYVGETNDEFGTFSWDIVNGVYHWDVSPSRSSARRTWLADSTASDFYLTMTARRVSGPENNSYGLVFRDDDANYYLFEISDSQYFGVHLRYDEAWISLIPAKESSAIRPNQSNRLAVLAQDSRFTFFVNDEKVGEVVNEKVSSGRVGIAIELYESGQDAAFEFDNFELWTP